MSSQFAHAITNPGFETGNFNGWAVTVGTNPVSSAVVTSLYNAAQVGPQPPVQYVPSTTVDPFGVFPTSTPSGNHFAKLTAAQQNFNISISQTFAMDFGYGLSGLAAFDSIGSNNDIAELIISGAQVDGGSQTIWNRSVSNTGPGGATPWEVWAYYAPAYGSYTLTFRLRNIGSSTQNSVALLDAVEIVHIPDNGSTLLMLGGVVIGLFGLSRKLVKA